MISDGGQEEEERKRTEREEEDLDNSLTGNRYWSL